MNTLNLFSAVSCMFNVWFADFYHFLCNLCFFLFTIEDLWTFSFCFLYKFWKWYMVMTTLTYFSFGEVKVLLIMKICNFLFLTDSLDLSHHFPLGLKENNCCYLSYPTCQMCYSWEILIQLLWILKLIFFLVYFN